MTIALDINSVRSIEIFQKTIEFMGVARKNGGAPGGLAALKPELLAAELTRVMGRND